MKIFAIDIGSNSVRLACIADGKTLYKRLETTRLGEGLSKTGKINSEALERTALAVSAFVCFAKKEGADRLYAFATAAVRAAENGSEFVTRVKELCGVTVDVISGEREAECGILGALRGRDGGIIDVGGASTEVTVQRGGKTVYSKSFDIGAVRLFDIAGRDKAKLEKVIKEKITEYGEFDWLCRSERSEEPPKMYAIGGTATTLASVKHGLKVYDPAITDGTVLTLKEIKEITEKLLRLSVEEVRALDGMEPRRADVIGGGCLLLYGIMKRFKIEEITVSESDNLEGYVLLKEELA